MPAESSKPRRVPQDSLSKRFSAFLKAFLKGTDPFRLSVAATVAGPRRGVVDFAA